MGISTKAPAKASFKSESVECESISFTVMGSSEASTDPFCHVQFDLVVPLGMKSIF